ncbi:copper-binding protein [Rhodanobacter sp. FW510-R12]|uniref:copper-binding protein n=1 Tax=unclassified Rhodanobacter TaxID=2621553 RepID=UPI0007A9B105|nr:MULTISPECIES: copper-binding protein [unclassified Rhodanobacter]KZC15710.1 copper-binding protein [Rhodanobacter sp. FW104-R8]KZC28967.1 copper-binding protein [Rhodanobacter sp. FW510-T8]KZC30469.1 copper-binding protein [Rhodanobacter sp. FW510-R10]
MKKQSIALAITAALIAAPVFANPQQMDPNMPGMAGMHEATPAGVQGVGVVKAIDAVKGTITLQHQAIAAIGWPAMTMPFKLASPDLLKHVKVGDKVRFTLRPDGMASTVMSIELVQPE